MFVRLKKEIAKDEITQTMITKSIEMQVHMLTRHERGILVNTTKSKTSLKVNI